MKVYILVLNIDYEGSSIISVHSSYEAATAAMATYLKERTKTTWLDVDIEEWEVKE